MPSNKRSRSSDDPETSQSKRAKPDIDKGDFFKCPICLDAVTLTGDHFIVATKCGHLFGNSCLEKWLSECPVRLKSCPVCKSRAVSGDIRRIFANNIVIVDVHNDGEEELVAVKKKLEELQNKIEMLELLGVKYCECNICDTPFYTESQRIKHNIEYHILRE